MTFEQDDLERPPDPPNQQDATDEARHGLHPQFPVVVGRTTLTDDWHIVLPEPMNRRIEDDDLVLWRPGFTLWIAAWNAKPGETVTERIRVLRGDSSPAAFGFEESESGQPGFAYRLAENAEDGRVAAFYAYSLGEHGHVQLAAYFDREEDVGIAWAIWQSISRASTP